MRSKRSVRLEAKWRDIVSGHPCSGQTVRAYCKARQVAEASFFFWCRELERRAQPLAASPRLIPVRVLPDPSKVDPNHWTVFCRFLASEIPLGISLVPVTQA